MKMLRVLAFMFKDGRWQSVREAREGFPKVTYYVIGTPPEKEGENWIVSVSETADTDTSEEVVVSCELVVPLNIPFSDMSFKQGKDVQNIFRWERQFIGLYGTLITVVMHQSSRWHPGFETDRLRCEVESVSYTDGAFTIFVKAMERPQRAKRKQVTTMLQSA